jgi:hypothetical protein
MALFRESGDQSCCIGDSGRRVLMLAQAAIKLAKLC